MGNMKRGTWAVLGIVLVIALAVIAGCVQQPAGANPTYFRDIRIGNSLDVDGSTSLDLVDIDDALNIAAGPATATPALYVGRSTTGDLAVFADMTSTPSNKLYIRTSEVEVDVDMDVDARVHVNPAATAAATATPDAVFKASGTNDVLVIENSSATRVWAADESGNLYQAGNSTFGGTITVGTSDTAGKDVTLYSETSGDYFLWDASAEALILIGTNAQTALDVQDGNVVVADTLDVNGTVDFDGTTFAVDSSGGFSIDDSAVASNVSVAGAGIDLTLSSAAGRVVIQGGEAAADAVYIDADGAAGNGLDIDVGSTGGMSVDGGCLNIGGGSPGGCGDNDLYVTGDLEIDTLIDLDGNFDQDGTTFDVDITGAVSIDADLASNLNAAAGDITVEAETGSIVLKGDEAAADAIYLDANDAAGTGVTIAVGSSGGVHIDGGLTDIGTGSYDTADGDNDLGVAGDLEVDGVLELDGALDADSTADIADTLTLSKASGTALAVSSGGSVTMQNGDLTISAPTTGNNAGARSEFIGLPRIKLVGLDGGTNPASETVACIDTDPDGEWAEVDAGTNLVRTVDTGYFRDSPNSVKIAFTDVVDNDGVDGTIVQDDLTNMKYLGLWIYSDVAISSGDFDITLDDTDGTDQVYAVGAVGANVWTWVEVDISGCNTNCDTTDGIKFLATTQGGTALTAANIYIDAMYYWDDTDQDSLGADILQDGVLGCIDPVTGEDLVEWTNFFVRYASGNDFLVWITDESAAFPFALVAY